MSSIIELPIDLVDLDLYGLTLLSSGLQKIGPFCASMHEAAQKMTQFLRANVKNAEGQSQIALARVFKSVRFKRLDPSICPAGFDPESRCLVLMGTDGQEEAWKDPARSQRHRVISLHSDAALNSAPMLVELLEQMGLDRDSVTGKGPIQPKRQDDPELGWFYIPNAVGSASIPDQQNFVIPYGIQSVVGFGWLLITGEAYIVILFCKVPVSHEVAAHLRRLASTIALGLMPFEKKLFPVPT